MGVVKDVLFVDSIFLTKYKECKSPNFDKNRDLTYNLTMISRIYQNLDDYFVSGRVLIIYGPRRVGKTVLLNEYLAKTKLKYLLDSGDNIKTQNILGSSDFDQILSYAAGYDLLVLDEAQNIPNIGKGLKILVDQLPNLKIIATGSSSFDLAGQVGEPLTGRKTTLTLYPLSQKELLNTYNKFELRKNLEKFLIFGSYPQVITSKDDQQRIDVLNELSNSYLLKDILALEKVKGSQVLVNLLKLLAFQVGHMVSLTKIGQELSLDNKTVSRYIDLLEKAFVIQGVTPFSHNLRAEIKHKKKYYFLDNGIRNAVISQFNGIEDRNDVGQLWENFMFSERLKYRTYNKIYANYYFWRDYSQKEVDLVEEYNGKLAGYEFKWGRAVSTTEMDFDTTVITPGNYLDFLF